MTRSEIALVIPTIRKDCFLDFLKRWKGIQDSVDILVMEDNPKVTFKTDEVYRHWSWEDIEELGNKQWIIPRRSWAGKVG